MPNRDVVDASWMLALDVEKAVLSSEDLCVALLDITKYFDDFKRHVLWPHLFYMCAPRKLMRAVAAYYDQGIRVMKVAGHYGEPFFAANGIGQGDPLSMRFYQWREIHVGKGDEG